MSRLGKQIEEVAAALNPLGVRFAFDRGSRTRIPQGRPIKSVPGGARDPYEALDDLMVVVEALCPRWPMRGIFKSGGFWLL